MTDVKRLLAEATPLPWVDAGYYGDHGDVFGCDLSAGNDRVSTGGGIEGGEGSMSHADAALIVHAVNTLPDYEAAADALAKITSWLAPDPAGAPGYRGRNWAIVDEAHEEARAALARLRGAS